MDIVAIKRKRDLLQDELKEYTDVIKAYQKICVHNWTDHGHDHKDSYHKCSICELEEWY